MKPETLPLSEGFGLNGMRELIGVIATLVERGAAVSDRRSAR